MLAERLQFESPEQVRMDSMRTTPQSPKPVRQAGPELNGECRLTHSESMPTVIPIAAPVRARTWPVGKPPPGVRALGSHAPVRGEVNYFVAWADTNADGHHPNLGHACVAYGAVTAQEPDPVGPAAADST